MRPEIFGCTHTHGELYKWNKVDAWVKVANQLGGESLCSLIVYNNAIFAGTINGLAKLYRWNGEDAWEEVAGQPDLEETILSLYVFGGELYGGSAPHGKLYRWNGQDTWIRVADQLEGDKSISSLCTYRGKLYAGSGRANDHGGPINPYGGKLFEWNGVNAWVKKADKFGEDDFINDLVVFNSKLYGGTGGGEPGELGTAGGRLLEWNGIDAWVQRANKFESPSLHNAIRDLCVFNGKIYAGTYRLACLFEWNGVDAWTKVATKAGGEEQYICCLLELDSKLYGGSALHARLYEWNGVDTWVEKASRAGGEAAIYDMAMFPNLPYHLSDPIRGTELYHGEIMGGSVECEFHAPGYDSGLFKARARGVGNRHIFSYRPHDDGSSIVLFYIGDDDKGLHRARFKKETGERLTLDIR